MNIYHDDYKEAAPLWRKVRDCIQGEDRIKHERERYLPMLTSQRESGDIYALESYNNYLLRASFYGAASRTQAGLVGAVMRRPATIEGMPDAQLQQLEDAAGPNYESLDAIVMQQLRDIVSVGRYGLLVERGDDATLPPYLCRFKAEDIVYWHCTDYGGRKIPTTVAIRQTYEEPKRGDLIGNQSETKEQMLILRLGVVADNQYAMQAEGSEALATAPAEELVYWQEYWRSSDKKGGVRSGELELVEVKVPTKNGGRFWNEIPMDIVNAIGGVSVDVEEPPMLGLSNVMLSHYRGSADLEWGRHMTAIPQPWVSGFQLEEGAKLVVGCGYAWASPEPGANAQYLEFSGAGLGHIREGLKDKEQQMAVLGARMLEEQPATAEAMGTVRLRQAGERSVLTTMAENVSEATTRALQRWMAWQFPAYDSALAETISYSLTADFDSSRMDPGELATLTQSLQAGTISWETYAFNLRRGEMLPPGVSDDDERDRIQIGAPGRSRKDELQMLQTDVREGRISQRTYLERVKALGMLGEVEVDAELQAAEDDKARAAEAQMARFVQQLPGERAGSDEPQEAAPVADEAASDPKVTLNELTLAVERLMRAGNRQGANALLKEAARLLGLRSLGKVAKQPPTTNA
jgi:hypothetical protein